ncbi:hypothetical protein [Rhodosalinus sp. K401]|uniref:hypothetical protein n=1 Tax=Rhodosalinus sp. K401 TaxID=3239195 RepID=UPI003524ED44
MTAQQLITVPQNTHPPACLTIATATRPQFLTKRFCLEDGKLAKHAGGVLIAGSAEVREIRTLQDFAALLLELASDQALIYGRPEATSIGLTTREAWEADGRPSDRIPRTNDTFHWPEGPAIMMLDYDPEDGSEPLGHEALVEVVRMAVPALRDIRMLWMPSASSFIRNAETGEEVSGLKGQRLYLLVADGRDIPRAGKVLGDRLWLQGHGYMKVSSAGSLLPRTLVDQMVWQPSRLDFAAGAQCEGPLVQDRGEPMLIAGETEIVDTKAAFPDLRDSEKRVVDQLQAEARAEKREEAEAAKAAWLDRRAGEIAGDGASAEAFAAARETAAQALETDVLPGAFVLHIVEGQQVVKRTVAELLDAPDRFDRAHSLDPLEPEYDGARAVGMLFLDGPRKRLHSFARGGTTYRLTRDRRALEIVKGEMSAAVDATLEVLREDPQLFDFGDEFVLVDRGRIHPLEEPALRHYLGGVIQFFEHQGAKRRMAFLDPPTELAKRVLALKARRDLKPLTGIITAPTLRLDGTVLEEPGYDSQTQLFFHPPKGAQPMSLGAAPGADEVRYWLEILWAPFEEFPFVDAVDRGVFLAGLLTAVLRPVLPTAPGFGIDAPTQGSGKTLLAKCLAALAGEGDPLVYPHVDAKNEDEIRKRLLSFFRTGASAMVWDNVLGTFDSAALAATLTSATFTDRILGRSESVTLPNRALFTMTGNNLALQGDLVRRILVRRIDPRMERPDTRAFDVDPLAEIRENRQRFVGAALNVLRGYLASGAAPPHGRMASFEAWSDLVRGAVCWVGETHKDYAFGDPMDAVARAVATDPDLEALSELLSALEAVFDHERFSSQDVMATVARYKDPTMRHHVHEDVPPYRLYEALLAINDKAVATPATLGKALGYRKDRIADGRVLRQSKDGHSKKSLWQLCPAS